MKINQIAFSGYPVTDMKRARAFYEGVLGLKPSSVVGDDQSCWVEYDIGPSTLLIGNGVPEWKPSAGGGCAALEIEDLDQALQILKEHSVAFQPPMESPVCYMVALSDPDGNSILLHKTKPLS